MSVDVLAAAAGVVASTLGGIYGGTLGAIGSHLVDGTLKSLDESRGPKAARAKKALAKAKREPTDAAIKSLASAFVALARVDAEFRAQMQAESRRIERQPQLVTIHAAKGSYVIVNKLDAGQQPTESTDQAGKSQQEFTLSEVLKKSPGQTAGLLSRCSQQFGSWLVSAAPEKLKDSDNKLLLLNSLTWILRAALVVLLVLPAALWVLVRNAMTEKDLQSFMAALVLGFIMVVAFLGLLAGGGGAEAAPYVACAFRDTTTGSGEITTSRVTDFSNYDVAVATTIGTITVNVDVEDHPCEALAFRRAVEGRKYRNVACDGLSYGLISCWPGRITNPTKIFKARTTGETPSADAYPAQGTMVLKIDDDATDWVTGLVAFEGDAASQYSSTDQVVTLGTVVSGLNILDSVVDADSHDAGDVFWGRSLANKPFKIKSISVIHRAPAPSSTPGATPG